MDTTAFQLTVYNYQLSTAKFVSERKNFLPAAPNKTAPISVIVNKGGEGMNDSELCERLDAVRGGDIMAFEEIYSDLKAPVMTVAMRITGDRHAAEDVLQEVFVRLYQSPPDPLIKKPRAYIFRMARNLAIDSIRVQQPLSLEDCEDFLQSNDPDTAGRLDIEAAMRLLPLEQRQVVSLHLNGGLKFREIAHITETPLGTVLWRYQKAIKRLQEILEVK